MKNNETGNAPAQDLCAIVLPYFVAQAPTTSYALRRQKIADRITAEHAALVAVAEAASDFVKAQDIRVNSESDRRKQRDAVTAASLKASRSLASLAAVREGCAK